MSKAIRGAAQALQSAVASFAASVGNDLTSAEVRAIRVINNAIEFAAPELQRTAIAAPEPTEVTRSTSEYWVSIRAGVIDALAERGLQIVTVAHRVMVVPIGKAEPTADERVSALMDEVVSYGDACMSEQRQQYRAGHESQAGYPSYDLPAMVAEIEQSARSLLGSQENTDAQSKAMFVARLENMSVSGDTWLTIPSVLALLNDCDMLASRAAMKGKA